MSVNKQEYLSITSIEPTGKLKRFGFEAGNWALIPGTFRPLDLGELHRATDVYRLLGGVEFFLASR